ncbi:DUF4190 domain-containing protein [Paenisporosarcina sp. TG20]|uniref:DUF4190 domain-containing protein n=1 Tax=Paenisporosarcina sp. TG20 TaxID=1211706 RepID=UPI0002FD792E|nr:DUF4190 domain-containing protein [Paenisporosarcina sp. TG20]
MDNTQRVIIEKNNDDNGLAVTAMILGILGVVLNIIPFLPYALSILAIIFGAIALTNPAKKGMAISGIILGIVGIVMKILFWIIIGSFGSVS